VAERGAPTTEFATGAALTRRGWTLLAVAATLGAGGLLVGIKELLPVAMAAVVLLGAAATWTKARQWRLDTERHVHPRRVEAGESARVEIAVCNRNRRRSPVLGALDPFDGGRRWATFSIAPLAPGEVVRSAYRLPTEQRGVFALGPLELVLSDPFGLVRTARRGATTSDLTVYPRVEVVRAPAVSVGIEHQASTGAPVVGARGDDFYALREYRTGDDLRRVHWASSARHDELMIRQEQNVWQGRLTLVGDLRASVHSPASLEMVLTAVASLAEAALRAGTSVRVLTSGGGRSSHPDGAATVAYGDTGFGASSAHRSAIMDLLASARAHPVGGVAPLLAPLRRAGGAAALIMATTDGARPADLSALGRMGAPSSFTAVIVERAPEWQRSAAGVVGAGTAPSPGRDMPVRVVRVPPGTSFASAWEQAARVPTRRRS
jgi:uncharacterized protein (DUF58 family)